MGLVSLRKVVKPACYTPLASALQPCRSPASASTEGQERTGATIARRGKRTSSVQLPSARQTRSGASRAGATLASEEAAKEALEEDKAVEDQALQESSLEGRPILVERGAEV